MNYEESLTRLKEAKKKLEDDESYVTASFFSSNGRRIWNNEQSEKRYKLIESVIEGYSQTCSGEISGDKIEQIFSEVEGFAKQKEEMKEILLTQKYFREKGINNFQQKGKILCFVGSPGVGKTFFARKLSEAMGRKFFSIAVGGEHDPEIITGSDPKYLGTKTGKIIKAIQETKSCDPVILIDEVEKIGDNHDKGNLKNALLHVLDPEQNGEFCDKYLDIKIDIGKITFVLTANDLKKISDPLRNRLEIIKLKAYNESEKFRIGKIIIEKTFQNEYKDINKDLFEIKDEALLLLINKISEDGVRQLKKKIETIINWCFIQWAKQKEKGEAETKIIICNDKINKLVCKEPDEKEKTKEDELRSKIKELEQEKEDLKKKSALDLELFKSLDISEDREHCNKCQRITCQTLEETCSLCELEEQVKKIEVIVAKKNLAIIEKIWQKQKLEWKKQEKKLQNGTKEEKEFSQQIKSSVERIERIFQQVQKNNEDSRQVEREEDLPWLIAGGIFLTLIVFLFGWVLVKTPKKKKKRERTYHQKWVSKNNYLTHKETKFAIPRAKYLNLKENYKV